MGRLIPDDIDVNADVNVNVSINTESVEILADRIADNAIHVIVVFAICSVLRNRLSK